MSLDRVNDHLTSKLDAPEPSTSITPVEFRQSPIDATIDRVFSENIVELASQFSIHASAHQSPVGWMMKVRKAALKAALTELFETAHFCTTCGRPTWDSSDCALCRDWWQKKGPDGPGVTGGP